MRVSRRDLIGDALLAVGGPPRLPRVRGAIPALYHRLQTPAMAETPPGLLSEPALRTLLATVGALVDRPIDVDHYADFFRWHAENLKGYNTLYERFTATVNRTARQSLGRDFCRVRGTGAPEDLDAAVRTRTHGMVGKLRTRVFDRDWELFDRHVVRPIVPLRAHRRLASGGVRRMAGDAPGA